MAAKKSGRSGGRRRRKSQKMQKQIAGILVVIVAAVCVVLFGGGVPNAVPELAPLITDEHAFAMHAIDVGQADAILLSKDTTYALIDAGETMSPSEREAREKLFAYLDSLGVKRPSGISSVSISRVSCPRTLTISVSMTPGATQFTRMPLGASSAASDRVRPTMACFVQE